MKTLLIVSVVMLAACGKGGSGGGSSAVTPPIGSTCTSTTLVRGGYGFNNLGGVIPILQDCGNGVATIIISGVNNPGTGVNGAVYTAQGLCTGQSGQRRTADFSELYFVMGSVTWGTTNTSGVEGITFLTDGQIYVIADTNYSCNVSFASGVPTYH